MTPAASQAPTGALSEYTNGIQEDIAENRFVKNALCALADLRKYILIEHPQELAEAASSLVLAEENIFDIQHRLRN